MHKKLLLLLLLKPETLATSPLRYCRLLHYLPSLLSCRRKLSTKFIVGIRPYSRVFLSPTTVNSLLTTLFPTTFGFPVLFAFNTASSFLVDGAILFVYMRASTSPICPSIPNHSQWMRPPNVPSVDTKWYFHN